ncbi:hypothetical protein G3M81_22825 [Bacillus paralicheniformis]|uniref:hypothetical protein n=1 Tax=Bacillus TaxID=1386 RepID=UPI0013EE7521|nr:MULTISPECIES: hypothetical protein [Bacillus]QII26927.1 hypothetical protein G3M80_20735 [Bacillus altitudinis]QII51395.1 hypothetical protein G3M81_22825 [Bacillus paralicheniformis]
MTEIFIILIFTVFILIIARFFPHLAIILTLIWLMVGLYSSRDAMNGFLESSTKSLGTISLYFSSFPSWFLPVFIGNAIVGTAILKYQKHKQQRDREKVNHKER